MRRGIGRRPASAGRPRAGGTRRFLALLAGLAWLASAACAVAQSFPARPVHLVVPYPPGGGTDTVARVLGQKLSSLWGQGVVIDNRPGAGSTVGTNVAAKAPPDGYTLLMSSSSLTFDVLLYRSLPYDPLRDLAPVSLVATQPHVLLVNPSVPAKSVSAFIALAKAKPGALSYGSGGIGSSPHLAMELFKSMAGIDLLHVPYKGAAPAMTDLLAGRVQAMMAVAAAGLPQVKSGALRALGVSSTARLPELPDVPTIADSGVPGYQFATWYGIQVPAHTPPDIIAKLNADIGRAMQVPEVRSRMAALGLEPTTDSPEAFGSMLRGEIDRWAKLAKSIGVKPQ